VISAESRKAEQDALEAEQAQVVSVNVSPRKTVRKKPVGSAELIENFGLEGDAHGGNWHRQVSLLSLESIQTMVEKGLKVGPGDFAENLTVTGMDLVSLPVGTHVKVGDDVLLEVTQIGKECHIRCAIYVQAGDCIMPREGIFARVLHGGPVKTGDPVTVLQ
jgi:MOSC domain-containing protein YiiM